MKAEKIGKKIEEAKSLYAQGLYEEAGRLAESLRNIYFGTISTEEFAETLRIEAWAYYYLGIKGDPDDKRVNVNYARTCAEQVLFYSKDTKRRLSAHNVLPLTLWVLDEESRAWRASNEALEEFPDEPSAWNTRGILARWAEDYEQGVDIGNEVAKKAVEKGDFLTTGHGCQNEGDALDALGRKNEAFNAYREAEALYRHYEKISGISATPHISRVVEKQLNIAARDAE